MSDQVTGKIRQHFRDAERETVISEFERNGISEERVQLALIKLSDGNVDKLREFIQVAKIDWRHVLAWAEYPEEIMLPTWRMESEKVTKIRQRDRQQYLNWLNSESER